MVVAHWRSRILERRIRRTFYYSGGRSMDRLSLPLTKAVVEYFKRNAPFDDLDFQYVSDVSYAGAVSPSVLVVAMIYLERMRLTNKDYFQSSDTADMLTSALLCATKFLFDEAESEFVYNDEWALSCSRTLACVNEKEVEFLNALHWDTMANETDFYRTLSELETFIAKNECAWRGFASYSDLLAMAVSDAKKNIWDEIMLPVITVVSVAVLTYSAAVLGLYYSSSSALHHVSTTSERMGFESSLLSPPTNVAFAPSAPPSSPIYDSLDLVSPPETDSTDDQSPMKPDDQPEKDDEMAWSPNWLPQLLLRSKTELNASYICLTEPRPSPQPTPPMPTSWPGIGYFYHTVAV